MSAHRLIILDIIPDFSFHIVMTENLKRYLYDRLDDLDKQFDKAYEDFMKRLDTRIKQFYIDRFEQGISQAEECKKKGDIINAYFHYGVARMLDKELKNME